MKSMASKTGIKDLYIIGSSVTTLKAPKPRSQSRKRGFIARAEYFPKGCILVSKMEIS